MVFCKIHDEDHGSDHLAIETRFNLEAPVQTQTKKLLFKEAPWQQIREATFKILEVSPLPRDTQGRCDRLMDAVSQAVQAYTPKAKPSPYAKRWWSKELTEMRGAQSRLRNAVRRLRCEKIRDMELERSAYTTTRQYHTAIRYQKKQHWEKFVAEQDNIWRVVKFLEPESVSSFARVSPLIRADESVTEGED